LIGETLGSRQMRSAGRQGPLNRSACRAAPLRKTKCRECDRSGTLSSVTHFTGRVEQHDRGDQRIRGRTSFRGPRRIQALQQPLAQQRCHGVWIQPPWGRSPSRARCSGDLTGIDRGCFVLARFPLGDGQFWTGGLRIRAAALVGCGNGRRARQSGSACRDRPVQLLQGGIHRFKFACAAALACAASPASADQSLPRKGELAV